MIFVTGGGYSGKRDFVAETLGYERGGFTSSLYGDASVFYGLESCTLEALAEEERVFSYLLEREVVICQELGCGLLSMDREVRRQQEIVARICCGLSRKATAVYRVQVGLGMKMK